MRDSGIPWTVVAERLTAGGHPTMNGGPWTYQHVQRLLSKPPPAERATAYSTRHWRARDRRGPAKLLKCVHCAENGTDKQARDWAHLHGTDPEDVMNYIPLCRKCHIAYDGSGHHKPHTDAARAKMSEKGRRAYAEGRRAAGNAHNSGKTHCPQDHEYTPENTYTDKRGYRYCIKCMRERTRQWRDAQKAKPEAPDAA